MTIGFIGLGGMGAGLVKNLALKGREVRCYDLDPAKMERMAGHGARPAASPRDVAGGAAILALCVTTAEAVEDLLFGPDGVASDLPAGAIVLDHTTVNPRHVERMNRLCAARGLRYAEAPMTRTPRPARSTYCSAVTRSCWRNCGRCSTAMPRTCSMSDRPATPSA
jgi:3-hydroxyisobutyrate dehydrogenase-like beta-hydroxyacid dehydrogenase